MISRKTYKQLVEQHSDALYGYIKKQLRDDAMSRDFVQESFLKLWETRFTVRSDAAKAWLYQTAYRKMLNYIRDNKRISYNENYEFCSHAAVSHDIDENDYLEYVFDQLTIEQKSIILQRDQQGYAYKEIAEILQINEGMVKNRLFQARKKFGEIAQQELKRSKSYE